MEALEAIRFPFLGMREDGESFEYLLFDIDQKKANFAIFKWMVNHTNLNLNETIHLFIPSSLTSIYQFRNDLSGVIKSIRKEENGQAHFYEILFDKEIPLGLSSTESTQFAQLLPSDTSLLKLLIKLVKDSVILKEGILIYLKHLYPYFSRIVNYSHKDYHSLHFIFDDIRNKIKKNAENLMSLYENLIQLSDPQKIPIVLNLEWFRENMEPEIILDLFLCTFGQLNSYEELLSLLKESKYETKHKADYYFINYLVTIKNHEKHLYSNYNQIALIYMKLI